MDIKYRSYLYLLILFAGLYGCLLIPAFFLQMGEPTQSSAWIHGLIEKKADYAESITEKKIIIVAGSSALFGLKAALIEQETGIKTVNLGVMAALGLDYMFDRAKRLAKPGDIILIPLEYGFYIDKFDLPSYDVVDYVLSRDPAYFHQLSLLRKLTYIGVLVKSDLVSRFISLLSPALSSQMSENSARSINQQGDEIGNVRGVNDRPDRLARIDSYVPDDFSRVSLNTPGVAAIVEFSSWCKDHQIKLLATFPNLMFAPQYKNPASRRFFGRLIAFYADIGVPVLGHPYDFMYEKADFFDSVYHLYADAAERRTYQLITLLQQKYPAFGGRK